MHQIIFFSYCYNCHTGGLRTKHSEGVRRSRRCNQTQSAITQKVDLTTGHLLKLKTRHLHCTYSLGNMTPINCDWLSGELVPYKRPDIAVDGHGRLASSPISTTTFLSSGALFREGEF